MRCRSDREGADKSEREKQERGERTSYGYRGEQDEGVGGGRKTSRDF